MVNDNRDRAKRVVKRVARAVGGEELDRLLARLDALEAEVQELRAQNQRIAELTDIVQELLLPVALQDAELVAAAAKKYAADL